MILAGLVEGPTHPYELANILKKWNKHRIVNIRPGSLYTAVKLLDKAGFIEPVDTFQAGRRPERTVYALTDEGRAELRDWISAILRSADIGPREFEVGLSLMPLLGPDRVLALLQERLHLLEEVLDAVREEVAAAHVQGLPRLFTVESDYRLRLLESEACWVRHLVEELELGTFEDLAGWRDWHRQASLEPAERARSRP